MKSRIASKCRLLNAFQRKIALYYTNFHIWFPSTYVMEFLERDDGHKINAN